MNLFDFMRACEIEFYKEEQEKNRAFQNKIGLKNYQENKELIDNAEKETSFKNTIEHINYKTKIRHTLIVSNLKDAIL